MVSVVGRIGWIEVLDTIWSSTLYQWREVHQNYVIYPFVIWEFRGKFEFVDR